MELGVYRYVDTDDSGVREFTRTCLFDFEAREWIEPSSGKYVRYLTDEFTPHEFRAVVEENDRRGVKMVRAPEWVREQDDIRVSVIDEVDVSVAEARKRKEEQGRLESKVERQYYDSEGIVVYAEDDMSDGVKAEYERRDDVELIAESEWDGVDWESLYDYDFYTS